MPDIGRRGSAILSVIILPGSTARSCWWTQWPRSMPDRKRCAISKARLRRCSTCFRTGRRTFWGTLFRPQIDRILLAATKADHLHHTSHDRLEAILKMLDRARCRQEPISPAPKSMSSRWPRCGRRARRRSMRGGENGCLASSARRLLEKSSGGETFDGKTEVALFPGDLPADPQRTVSQRRPGISQGWPRARRKRRTSDFCAYGRQFWN